MPRVKVFNDNVHPLKEIFKGNEVEIKAKDYWRNIDGSVKEMDIYEASEFKGQYHPGPIDTDGKILNDSKYFKMIKVEPIETKKAEFPENTGHRCMVCKHVSPSAEELEAHNKVRHANQLTAEGTAEGPLTRDASSDHTRPVFQQNMASPGKEDSPSTKKRTA